MIRKKTLWRSLVCFLTAVLLLTASPLTALQAQAVTQAEIDDLREQLKELEAQVQAQQEVINSLTENKARVVDRKIALDAKIDLTRRQIQLIRSQVEIYDQIVADKQAELEQAQEAENAQAELLRTRMRAMEENGNNSYISFLFDSSSLTDLLARLADVDDIMHYDKTLEAEYKAAREDVEIIKKSYEETLAEQESLSKELDRKTEELDAQIVAAYTLIADLNDQSDNAQAEFDAIDKARAEADAEIDALVKKLAEEEAARKAAEEAARAAAAAAGGTAAAPTGGSAVSLTSLMWPCPGVNIITSRFGYRTSPTAGASSYHGGLDIGAGAGSSIVAAESGQVVLASYNGGYGNCVMINHGNGIVTLYGHMESIAVGYGQYVGKGQTIGYVGSTGVSTGPHCHFEIRVNGAQTDPAPYFSGLVYYNC